MNACAYLAVYSALVTAVLFYALFMNYKARRDFRNLKTKWEEKRAIIQSLIAAKAADKNARQILDLLSLPDLLGPGAR